MGTVPDAVPDAVPGATTAAGPAAVGPAALQITPDDEVKRVRLVQMKRVATLMLVGVAVLFVVTRFLESRYPWLGFVRAFAEAAMVGGIADWFAVTALFRHPLGIPIPHTAIIPRQKDRLARGMSRFLTTHFFTETEIRAALERLDLAAAAGRWLAEPANA